MAVTLIVVGLSPDDLPFFPLVLVLPTDVAFAGDDEAVVDAEPAGFHLNRDAPFTTGAGDEVVVGADASTDAGAVAVGASRLASKDEAAAAGAPFSASASTASAMASLRRTEICTSKQRGVNCIGVSTINARWTLHPLVRMNFIVPDSKQMR